MQCTQPATEMMQSMLRQRSQQADSHLTQISSGSRKMKTLGQHHDLKQKNDGTADVGSEGMSAPKGGTF